MEPGESAMQAILRVACDRLVATEPLHCEPESLAAEAGIDPTVARDLFPDGNAVVRTVMESALRRQMDYLTRKLSEVSGEDPVAQLIAFGKAGVEWAVENRDDYHILTFNQCLGRR